MTKNKILVTLNDRTSLLRQHKFLLFVLSFHLVLLLFFWWSYPTVFGWDAVNRIINHDRIFVEHWLPGLQVLIYSVYKFKAGLLGLRILLILIALGATTALYLFISKQFTRTAAALTCLLFMTTPALLTITTVPYQEMLLYLLVFFGMYLYQIKYNKYAFVVLGMACLVRYEVWIFCLLLALVEIYLATRSSNTFAAIKRLIVTIPLVCWGIAVALLLRYLSVGKVVDYTVLDDAPVGILVLTKAALMIIRKNIIIFSIAITGVIYFLLGKNRKSEKTLWLMLLFFLLFTMCTATLRAAMAPSSYRTYLLPVTTSVLFAPYAIILLRQLALKLKRNELIIIGNILIALVCVSNIHTAYNLFETINIYTFFDEHYTAAQVAKEHRGRKILIVEPENFADFAVTSIYLNKKDNASIWPSSRCDNTDLHDLIDANFEVIVNIGGPCASIFEIKNAMAYTERQIDNIQVIEFAR
jgi:hypothetical protein